MTALYALVSVSIALAISTVFWMAVSAYQQHKLMQYVKKNRRESWEEITRVFGRTGGRNAFKGLAYIDGPRDDDDTNILAMKSKLRRSLRWLVGSFIAAFTIAVLIAWVGYKLND